MNSVFFAPVAMGLAVTLLVLFLMTRGRKTMLKICIAIAVPAFFGGLVLYTIGYMPEGGTLSDALTAMLRGLFSTGRMFLINDDYGFLLDDPSKAWLTGGIAFQIIFWLCHVLALVVSVSAVMGLFGYRLMAVMRLRLRIYHSCTIICGCGENALTLGENIATHDGARPKPDPKRLVVYLVPELTDELNETLAAFGAIALETGKAGFAKGLRTAGLAASPWRVQRCRVVLMPGAEADAMAQLRQTLQTAAELSLAPQRLSIHLLSENEWVWQHLLQNPHLAQNTWPIHIAGEAELAARRMILAQPPCLALSFDKAVAQEDLVVLVLGFGKTGQQALRRLVMNGQFVGSRMCAAVVDRDVSALCGAFEESYPGFATCCEIEYHVLDVRSTGFFALLDSLCPQVNYVVAALNDDGLNLEAAQAVESHFARCGRRAPRMALAVSVGQGAEDAAGQTVFFSRQSEIYSEATVIRAQTDAMAMAVHAAYMQSSAGESVQDPRQLWYGLDLFSQESSRASADFIPTMLHLTQLSEQAAMQRETLTDDEKLAETLAHTEHLRWNAFHCAMGYTPMPPDAMARRFAALRAAGQDAAACRKDAAARRHACLVPWGELPAVSETLNHLFAAEGLPTRRDFQKEDSAIIRSIPACLRQKDQLAKEDKTYVG